MKKQIATTIALVALSSSTFVNAGTNKTIPTEAKQSATFFTSVVAGTVAGGPIGFMVGALGGAYLGEQIKQADEVETMNKSLAQANMTIEELNQQLLASEDEMQDMQELVFESLSLPVLFETGSDTLNDRGRQHIYSLVSFLQKYPQYKVSLNGHTDPRGTDEYNNVLSMSRAVAVKSVLQISGIDGQRILVNGYGASQSTAIKGDQTAYAQERRVDIELLLDENHGLVMY